jgi:hypothetical protein
MLIVHSKVCSINVTAGNRFNSLPSTTNPINSGLQDKVALDDI